MQGSTVVQNARQQAGTFGFNAETEAYVDLVANGSIDPAKGIRTAPEDYRHIGGAGPVRPWPPAPCPGGEQTGGS